MTPQELILMHLAVRPMVHNDLMRATGLRRNELTQHLNALAGECRIWRKNVDQGRDRCKMWNLGADPQDDGPVARDYSVQRAERAPGHTVVRFGDRWRASHGQRQPAAPGRDNALGNIYA